MQSICRWWYSGSCLGSGDRVFIKQLLATSRSSPETLGVGVNVVCFGFPDDGLVFFDVMG